MERRSITKFKFIGLLIKNIQDKIKDNERYDWYFGQLIQIYKPFIIIETRKIYSKLKYVATYQEIKTRVLEFLLESVIKYKLNYTSNICNNKNFDHVYFSNYLKKRMPWERSRFMNPSKVENSDIIINSVNVELDETDINVIVKSRKTFQESPISSNFISLCRMLQRHLKNDIYADVMMLYYGYGCKNREISKLLHCSPRKVSQSLIKIKDFFRSRSDLLMR